MRNKQREEHNLPTETYKDDDPNFVFAVNKELAGLMKTN